MTLASPTFQFQSAASVFSTLEVGVFFFFFFFSLSLSLSLSCKMLVPILLGMHASAYFIFGIFISILFFAVIYAMLS